MDRCVGAIGICLALSLLYALLLRISRATDLLLIRLNILAKGSPFMVRIFGIDIFNSPQIQSIAKIHMGRLALFDLMRVQ